MYRQNINFLSHTKTSKRLTHAIETLARHLANPSKNDPMNFMTLPSLASLQEYVTLSHELRSQCEKIVVLGQGAATSCGAVYHGLASHNPTIDIIDNIDKDILEARLQEWRNKKKKIAFIFISRSGETHETLALLHFLWDRLHTEEHISFLCLCGGRDNRLGRFCQDNDIRLALFDKFVSGRYSMFHPVGLFVAMLAGLKIEALLQGAKNVLANLQEADFAPAQGAAMIDALHQKRPIHVFLSYSDILMPLMHWLVQLYAESLGKQGRGITPIAARGATDEHSQMQLWCEGPKDKAFSIFGIATDNHELGMVLTSHRRAAIETLQEQGYPVRVMEYDKLNEQLVGALVMHHMLEVYCLSFLWDINPFDEPSVRLVKDKAHVFHQELLAGRAS